jgi:ATP-dependent Lon protease
VPGSIDQEKQQIEIPEMLPLIPVRDLVVFPNMVLPLFVGREVSIKAIEEAIAADRMVVLAAQKSLEIEAPQPDEIYSIGTVCTLMRMLKLPDGRVKILVQGVTKVKIASFIQLTPFYKVKVERLAEPRLAGSSLEVEAVLRTVKEQMEKIVSFGRLLVPDVIAIIENLEDRGCPVGSGDAGSGGAPSKGERHLVEGAGRLDHAAEDPG